VRVGPGPELAGGCAGRGSPAVAPRRCGRRGRRSACSSGALLRRTRRPFAFAAGSSGPGRASPRRRRGSSAAAGGRLPQRLQWPSRPAVSAAEAASAEAFPRCPPARRLRASTVASSKRARAAKGGVPGPVVGGDARGLSSRTAVVRGRPSAGCGDCRGRSRNRAGDPGSRPPRRRLTNRPGYQPQCRPPRVSRGSRGRTRIRRSSSTIAACYRKERRAQVMSLAGIAGMQSRGGRVSRSPRVPVASEADRRGAGEPPVASRANTSRHLGSETSSSHGPVQPGDQRSAR